MSIKGYKSQQALQQKLAGYSEDQSIDKLRYTTIQEMSGRRHALDVLVHGAYQITTVPKTIETGSNIRTIKITSHGANNNDIIRLSNGTQFSALSIPDANTIITSVELDVSPVGDTCTIWRHITPSYNADGSLNVIASQAPIKFNKDGVSTAVNYVTATPTSSDALPVNIVTVNGQGIATTVDLSGAQINVQLTDRGTSPDAVRIGDGTNLAAITASNAVKVDASATTQPISNAALNVDIAASGSITGIASTQIATSNYGSVSFAVAGTWTGTITVEVSQDNSTWYPTSYVSLASGNTSSTFTANTAGQINVVGFAYCRLKGATVSSGTAFVNFIASNKVATVMLDNPLPAGSNNIGNINNITGTITLPTLAATSTLQTTGNSSLSSIDTKTPALGQALAAASTPVVLTAAQMTTLTPLSSVTVTQATGTNLHTVIDSGTVTVNALTNSSVVKAQLQDNAGTAIVLGQQAVTASVPVALSSRHEAAATPVSMRQGDGTNFLSSIALAAAQLTSGALTAIRMSAAVAMGWDGATHREIAVDTSGQQKVVQQTSSGTITQASVTVGVAAVRATVAGTAPSASRKRLLISPLKTNSGAIYLGSSAVTTANGLEIIGPDRMEFILDASDYYLISDTAGQAVRIVEVA